MLGIWPISARAKEGVVGFIIALIIYVVLAAVGGFVIGLISKVGGLVGWIIGIAGGCLDLYCFIGIIIAILVLFKVVK